MLCLVSVQSVLDGPTEQRDPLSSPVLLLNQVFIPIRFASARRALALLYSGVARAMDGEGELFDFERWLLVSVTDGPDAIGTTRGALRIPRLLHLERYDRIPRRQLRLNRRNLLLRDNYECQYCGARPGSKMLSVDHVLPRSRGGDDCWANLVICCRRCNLRKRDRTPHEASMRLHTVPRQPPWSHVEQLRLSARTYFPEWVPFLGNIEPQDQDRYRRTA